MTTADRVIQHSLAFNDFQRDWNLVEFRHMPELPEVETIRRDLSKLIVGKKILDITTDSPKQVQPSLAVVRKAIVGVTIKRVERRAKLLQIFLSNGKILAIHLKLTGRLLVRKRGDPPDDWQHVTIKLQNSKTPKLKREEIELRFCDLRKFGWIKLVNSNQLSVISNELGIEPFDKEFTVEYLRQVFSRTSRPIKLVLLDQKKIAGVGNIYANEALFEAGIRPDKQAKILRYEDIKILRETIIKVLREGVKYGGSSAADEAYIRPDATPGKYQEYFRVYQRAGEKCPKCKATIKRFNLGGRGTFFCPRCQK